MSLNIEIKTIPQSEQRYPTCGDYWDEDSKEVFRISEMGNWRHEFLVAIHELVEKAICKHRGIKIEDIDEFDLSFENKDGEPGDDPMAPYYKEHQIAMGFERLMAAVLEVNWEEYDEKINFIMLEDEIDR